MPFPPAAPRASPTTVATSSPKTSPNRLEVLIACLGEPAATRSRSGPTPSNPKANTPTSQKVIKDPAEYNAYITALNTTDPAAKG